MCVCMQMYCTLTSQHHSSRQTRGRTHTRKKSKVGREGEEKGKKRKKRKTLKKERKMRGRGRKKNTERQCVKI